MLIREKVAVYKIEKEIPSFEINKDYLKNLEEAGYSEDQKIMEMKNALTYHIRINLDKNPLYETLSQRLERIIKEKEKKKLILELEQLIEEINKIEDKARQLGLSDEEYALLNVINKYAPESDEKENITFIKSWLADVKKDLFARWHEKSSEVRKIEEKVFSECLQKFSKTLKKEIIVSMAEEIVKFLIRYNP